MLGSLLSLTQALVALIALASASNAQVAQTWVFLQDGPASGSDGAAALAVAPNGDFLVTGQSAGLGPNKHPQDIVTLRLDPGGALLWSQRYDGARGGDDWGQAVALDPAGAAIVGGLSQGGGSQSSNALVLIKYDPNGSLQWARRFEPSGEVESLAAMAVDPLGNTIVTSSVDHWSQGTWDDILTMSYGPAGNLQWATEFAGPGDSIDDACDLATDSSGHVYVAGLTGILPEANVLLLKYDPDGALAWSREHDPEGNCSAGVELALDSNGRVYVASSVNYDIERARLLLLAWNESGDLLWSDQWQISEQRKIVAKDLTLGPGGDIYCAAESSVDDYHNPSFESLVFRYNPEGDLLWADIRDSFYSYSIQPKQIRVDPAGNCYVAADNWYSFTASGNSDLCTYKLGPNGVLAWVELYDGTYSQPWSGGWDEASAIVLGPSGHVVVAGVSHNEQTSTDLTVIRYDQDPLPTVYCTSKASSLPGCVPTLGSASALASLSTGPSRSAVVCAPIPGGSEPAIAIASTGGPLTAPVLQTFGWLCIEPGPAWFRLPPDLPGGTNGQCNGFYEFDVGAWLASQAGNPALAAGGTLDLQVWYRDPPNPGGANLSNAIGLSLVP